MKRLLVILLFLFSIVKTVAQDRGDFIDIEACNSIKIGFPSEKDTLFFYDLSISNNAFQMIRENLGAKRIEFFLHLVDLDTSKTFCHTFSIEGYKLYDFDSKLLEQKNNIDLNYILVLNSNHSLGFEYTTLCALIH